MILSDTCQTMLFYRRSVTGDGLTAKSNLILEWSGCFLYCMESLVWVKDITEEPMPRKK